MSHHESMRSKQASMSNLRVAFLNSPAGPLAGRNFLSPSHSLNKLKSKAAGREWDGGPEVIGKGVLALSQGL